MTSPTAEQFLSSVHRRRLAFGAADAACWAVGTGAVATAAAVPFLPRMCWMVGAAGFIVIVAVKIRERAAGRFGTAVDVDRLLKSDDLLTSAVYGTGADSGTDPVFAARVREAADARFSAVDPSALAARQIGFRGWTLALILVAAAAVLVSRPQPGRATGRAEDGSAAIDEPAGLVVQTPAQTAGAAGARVPRITDEQGSSQIGSGDSAADNPATSAGAASGGNDRADRGSAGGGGAGQSQTPGSIAPPLTSAGNRVQAGGTRTGDGSTPGTGQPGAGAEGTHGAAASASGEAPWRSNHWTAARAAADAAVSSGAVPARARSLVRAYFDGE